MKQFFHTISSILVNKSRKGSINVSFLRYETVHYVQKRLLFCFPMTIDVYCLVLFNLELCRGN